MGGLRSLDAQYVNVIYDKYDRSEVFVYNRMKRDRKIGVDGLGRFTGAGASTA